MPLSLIAWVGQQPAVAPLLPPLFKSHRTGQDSSAKLVAHFELAFTGIERPVSNWSATRAPLGELRCPALSQIQQQNPRASAFLPALLAWPLFLLRLVAVLSSCSIWW